MVGKASPVFGNEMFTKSITIYENGCMTIILARERRLFIPAVVSPPQKRTQKTYYFQNRIRFILGFLFNQFSDKRSISEII